MKILDEGYLADLMNLQRVIAENLPEAEIFILHDEEYFREIFQFDRSVIGVTIDDGLAAYSIIRIPGLAEDNLGRDIGLSEEEQKKVAHLQAIAVHPAFRGQGLQRKLILAHLRILEDMRYEHICCTVSPKNPISVHNFFSCGFAILGLRRKFEGWLRYIMYKNIFPHKDICEEY